MNAIILIVLIGLGILSCLFVISLIPKHVFVEGAFGRIYSEALEVANKLPLEVAELPEIEITNIETFEHFKEYIDKSSDLAKILNKDIELFDIRTLDYESYERASKIIQKYSPLIDNYNKVVISAKIFRDNETKENLESFYKSAGQFGLELGVIQWTVCHKASYESVGIVYKAVKLNKFAFKYPGTVSVILSNSYWLVKGGLVEGSSKSVEYLFGLIDEYEKTGQLSSLSIEELSEKTQDYIKSVQEEENIQIFVNETKEIIDSNVEKVTETGENLWNSIMNKVDSLI